MDRSSPSRPSRVQPGGHPLRREVVVHHQRQRILAAAVDLVAERGYRAVTVADIVKRAATARLKFYENFSSKQDCFLAAYDAALAEATRRVGEATATADASFPERVSSGLAALLDYAAAEPALARACLVEAPSLGPVMAGRREQALAAFVPLLAGARQEVGETDLPDSVEESILDGLYWLLYDAILTGQPDPIEDLSPQLVEFALLPFLGAEAAQAAASSE
jgi:AcrR family transcriptional regulator